MARDLDKDAANKISIGNGVVGGLLHGSAAVSVHAMVNIDATSSGANDNRIVNLLMGAGTSSLLLMVDGTGASRRVRLGGRSVSGDGFQTRSGTTGVIALNTWTPIGGVFNYAADTISPYVNGVVDNAGAVTFGNSAYTHSGTATDYIAHDGATSANAPDGRIAEVCFWNVALAADDYAAMAAGVVASSIRPESIVAYWPLYGTQSPEPDLFGGIPGTIVGTVPEAPHCRVVGWRTRHRAIRSSTAPATNPFFFHRHVLSRRAG